MGERITFKTNGATTPAYLAQAAAPGPGIVVIQEWWGLVPHIERNRRSVRASRIRGVGA